MAPHAFSSLNDVLSLAQGCLEVVRGCHIQSVFQPICVGHFQCRQLFCFFQTGHDWSYAWLEAAKHVFLHPAMGILSHIPNPTPSRGVPCYGHQKHLNNNNGYEYWMHNWSFFLGCSSMFFILVLQD